MNAPLDAEERKMGGGNWDLGWSASSIASGTLETEFNEIKIDFRPLANDVYVTNMLLQWGRLDDTLKKHWVRTS